RAALALEKVGRTGALEDAIAACVRPGGEPSVNWDGIHECVSHHPVNGLLYLALMCAHGSAGFGKKIAFIKCQRWVTDGSLLDAKRIGEQVIERLTATANTADKRECVRAYFGSAPDGLPQALLDLLNHPVSWYRWAGLELLEAWGAPEVVAALVAE